MLCVEYRMPIPMITSLDDYIRGYAYTDASQCLGKNQWLEAECEFDDPNAVDPKLEYGTFSRRRLHPMDPPLMLKFLLGGECLTCLVEDRWEQLPYVKRVIFAPGTHSIHLMVEMIAVQDDSGANPNALSLPKDVLDVRQVQVLDPLENWDGVNPPCMGSGGPCIWLYVLAQAKLDTRMLQEYAEMALITWLVKERLVAFNQLIVKGFDDWTPLSEPQLAAFIEEKHRLAQCPQEAPPTPPPRDDDSLWDTSERLQTLVSHSPRSSIIMKMAPLQGHQRSSPKLPPILHLGGDPLQNLVSDLPVPPPMGDSSVSPLPPPPPYVAPPPPPPPPAAVAPVSENAPSPRVSPRLTVAGGDAAAPTSPSLTEAILEKSSTLRKTPETTRPRRQTSGASASLFRRLKSIRKSTAEEESNESEDWN